MQLKWYNIFIFQNLLSEQGRVFMNAILVRIYWQLSLILFFRKTKIVVITHEDCWNYDRRLRYNYIDLVPFTRHIQLDASLILLKPSRQKAMIWPYLMSVSVSMVNCREYFQHIGWHFLMFNGSCCCLLILELIKENKGSLMKINTYSIFMAISPLLATDKTNVSCLIDVLTVLFVDCKFFDSRKKN